MEIKGVYIEGNSGVGIWRSLGLDGDRWIWMLIDGLKSRSAPIVFIG